MDLAFYWQFRPKLTRQSKNVGRDISMSEKMIVPIKLLLVDDHAFFRQAISKPLSEDPRFNIVAEASSGPEALRYCLTLRPDIVLLDIRMPLLTGIELLQKLEQHNVRPKVIILTGDDSLDHFADAFQFGAYGFLLKDSVEPVSLASNLVAVSKGSVVIDPIIIKKFVASLSNGSGVPINISKPVNLSPANLLLLRSVALGYNNAQLSELMGISTKTVSNRLTQLFRDIDVDNRVKATHYALRTGIVQLAELLTPQ